MTSYTRLISDLRAQADGGFCGSIPESWMQGRTTYGGLTAALCLEAARRIVADIPLRSAQIAFVGPVGGDVELHPVLLRRGKNAAFVRVDLSHDDQVLAQCIFTFGLSRPSSLNVQRIKRPDVTELAQAEPFFKGPRRPNFTHNFNVRLAAGEPPISGSTNNQLGLWLRHKDENAGNDAASILALADCAPPAALPMLTGDARASSMTWMAEFLTDQPSTDEGWWLSLSTAETAVDGYSSQSMCMWSKAGEPTLIGRQTVAIFG